jgi:hypothetical protein
MMEGVAESYQTFIASILRLFGKTMLTRPTAPESLPQYLAEGVPKQDDENLHALQDWIDDLLEYRQDVAAEDIDVSEGESIEAVEESSSGTVVIKKVSCGKDNCKCQSGELHGPYKYVVRRQGNSLDWDYKGPVSE